MSRQDSDEDEDEDGDEEPLLESDGSDVEPEHDHDENSDDDPDDLLPVAPPRAPAQDAVTATLPRVSRALSSFNRKKRR